jgi:hypothetical protein
MVAGVPRFFPDFMNERPAVQAALATSNKVPEKLRTLG